MNDQQRDLASLLRTALADLEAGRPAERTAYALQMAIRATPFDDMTSGEADDQAWRRIRGAA
jgi:hypothetical protein